MRKIGFLLLVLCLLIPVIVQAQDAQNYVIIKEPTNVRSVPLAVRLRLGTVSQGILTVTGRNFDANLVCTGSWDMDKNLWLQVDYYGLQGWVKFCAVNFEGDLDTVPLVTPLQVHNPIYCYASLGQWDDLGEEPAHPNVIASTRFRQINLRQSATLESEVIDMLKGDQVYVIGRTSDNVWMKVHYHGVIATCIKYGWLEKVDIEGWVAAYLLKMPSGWQDIIPIIE